MKDVSLRRDGTRILQDVSWNVGEGENWAIIGLNGSGKTSILSMISGYIFPSSGQLKVLGCAFGECDIRQLRRSIGWVSSSLQENLHADDSAEDIVLSGRYASIGLYEKPAKSDISKANELMEQFGCTGFRLRPYSTLSQGERQRVVLARALMNSPKLLILDEPCTGLDLFAREHFLSAVTSISESPNPPTILYVSHHIEEILPAFGRTLLLKKGKVHSAGKSLAILTEVNLTDFFEFPVSVAWRGQRPWIHVDGL